MPQTVLLSRDADIGPHSRRMRLLLLLLSVTTKDFGKNSDFPAKNPEKPRCIESGVKL